MVLTDPPDTADIGGSGEEREGFGAFRRRDFMEGWVLFLQVCVVQWKVAWVIERGEIRKFERLA